MKNIIKNIKWAIRHPLYALCWARFKQPYSAIYTIAAVLALAAMLAVTGCGLTPVPRTTFTATIGGQKFSYSNPKQATATNIVCEISTNGTARMSIGAISSVNDPAVVDKSYAGQALVTKEFFTGVNTMLQSAAALGAKTVVP
jgi:hypothetical protein